MYITLEDQCQSLHFLTVLEVTFSRVACGSIPCVCPSSPGCLAVPVGFAGGGLYATSEHLSPGRGVRSGACLAWRSPVFAGWLPRRQPSDSGARLVPASLRFMLDARAFMISTLRSQVGFAAAVAHARLRLPVLASRALLGDPAAAASRYASTSARAFISPTAFEQARGGALGAGGGRVGFAGGGLF